MTGCLIYQYGLVSKARFLRRASKGPLKLAFTNTYHKI